MNQIRLIEMETEISRLNTLLTQINIKKTELEIMKDALDTQVRYLKKRFQGTPEFDKALEDHPSQKVKQLFTLK